MPIRVNLWARTILFFLCVYSVLGGATFSGGMLTPRYQIVNLILISAVGLLWFVAHWRGYGRRVPRWRWGAVPLELAIGLWVVTIGVSLAANLELWRRIAIGMWYVGLYILVWYALQDALANRTLTPAALTEGILLAGGVVMVLPTVQLVQRLTAYLAIPGDIRGAMTPLSDLVRLSGTLENPNRLAVFLVLLLPLALARMVNALRAHRRVGGAFWAGYSALAGVLLIFAFSRGGWLSGAGAVIAFAALLLLHSGFTSPARVRAWWQEQSGHAKALVGASALIILIAGVGAVLVFFRISATQTRLGDQRGMFYTAAVALFQEKPLTGTGLYTYGQGLLRFDSMPPRQVHSHAHSVPFTVAAELGLLGLIALTVSGGFVVWGVSKQWRALNSPEHAGERILLAGGIAGVVGFCLHHLTDFTAVTAVIPLAGLVVLAAIVPAPLHLSGAKPAERYHWRGIVSLLLLAVLLGGALYSYNAYALYYDALVGGYPTGDYRRVAEGSAAAQQRDPNMPVYPLMAAYFTMVDGTEVTRPRVESSLAFYDAFLALEPYYAPAWANDAALHWWLGQEGQKDEDRQAAIRAMRRAGEVAPDAWEFHYNLGVYLEQMDFDETGMRTAYERALERYPGSRFYQGWEESALRRQIAETYIPLMPLTAFQETLRHLQKETIPQAVAVWADAPQREQNDMAGMALSVILAVESGADIDSVELALNRLERYSETLKAFYAVADIPFYGEWLALGRGYGAWRLGDKATAEKNIRAVCEAFPTAPRSFPDIVSSHFLRIAVPDYLLPQVYSPKHPAEVEFLLRRLVGRADLANAPTLSEECKAEWGLVSPLPVPGG